MSEEKIMLQWISEIQGRWSLTATNLKRIHERARWLTFALAILGALSTAVASQEHDESHRQALAVIGATLLALGAFVTARFLDTDRVTRYARARSAAEALKRAAFMFAAHSAPFDQSATREAMLQAEVQKIEYDVDDLLVHLANPQRGSTPEQSLDKDAYVAQRVLGAAEWYDRAAMRHHATAQRMRMVELVLALLTTLLAAVIGAVSREWLRSHTGFDWAALVAVLTTISGVVLAHVEAGRYDYLVTSYRAAARRLRGELIGLPAQLEVPSNAWSDFVARCEDIIANETGSWAARFSKPQAR